MPPEALKSLLRPEHSNGRVRLLILVAMVLGTVRLMEATPLQSANDRSRWATVYSLVHHNTYAIDEVRKSPGWDTIDKVRLKDQTGAEHFYSSKPPLFSTIVAGGYWVIKNSLGWTIDPGNLDTVTPISRLLLFLVNIVPTALALGSFATLVWRHCDISFTRTFLLAGACFATLWSAYLPSLNNHTPAVCCVVFALRAAVVTIPSHISLNRAAVAGLMAGTAVTFELPALAFLGGVFVILLKYAPKRALAGFVPAAIVPLALFLIVNKVAIGDWAPAYAAYGQENGPYRYVENGVPSYWMNPKGLDTSKDPFYTYLFHCTLGHHGLFSLTPIFLLSLMGLLRFQKWRFSVLAPFHMLGALLTIVVLGFYLSRVENYNYGGVSVGLRWLLWLIPFWLLMMAPAVDLLSANRLGQGLLLLLMAPSIFSAWYPFDAPWKQPWIFNALREKGRLKQYDEAPLQFRFPRHTWIAQLPAGETADSDYWIEMSGVAVDGAAITLRVADGGRAEVGDRQGRRVNFVWNQGRASETSTSVILDPKVVNDGEGDEPVLFSEDLAGRELVYGLPANSPYRLAARRYVRLPVRNDAFLTDIGVGWGARQTTSAGIETVTMRSEFWNTSELPFGVAYWDLQTTHSRTGALLAERRLSIVRAGKILPLPPPSTTN